MAVPNLHIAAEGRNMMAAGRFSRQLLACCLTAVFAGAMAQSLGDLAREQRQKKASAAPTDAAKQKTFSNLDDPQPQATTPNGRKARNATSRPDMPVSLSQLSFSSLIFETPGETHDLVLLAHFSDGSDLDITESERLTFHSTDTKIVTVDATGTIMAVATGTASIIVSYSNPNGPELQLKIPVTVLRFQVTFSPSSLDFGNVQVGRSASLTLTVTNNSFGDMHLRIKSVTATGHYSKTDNCISSSPLAVGNACVITASFKPVAPGQSPGTLSIISSSGSVPSVILLSGVGVK
jgi:hypothetical protein